MYNKFNEEEKLKQMSQRWEDMSEKTLERFISDMNTIFIYGYGSNQVI